MFISNDAYLCAEEMTLKGEGVQLAQAARGEKARKLECLQRHPSYSTAPATVFELFPKFLNLPPARLIALLFKQ
jgi:hypothetical protein